MLLLITLQNLAAGSIAAIRNALRKRRAMLAKLSAAPTVERLSIFPTMPRSHLTKSLRRRKRCPAAPQLR